MAVVNAFVVLKIDQAEKVYIVCIRVPTQTGKPGKMGRHFLVREKSGNFDQIGKVRENPIKY